MALQENNDPSNNEVINPSIIFISNKPENNSNNSIQCLNSPLHFSSTNFTENKIDVLKDLNTNYSPSKAAEGMASRNFNELNTCDFKKISRLPDIDDDPSINDNLQNSKLLSPVSKKNGAYLEFNRSKNVLKVSPKKNQFILKDLLLKKPFATSTPAKYSQFIETSDLVFSPSEKVKDPIELSFENSETKTQGEAQEVLIKDLRTWRQDALQFHLYETAIFWGNKILMLKKNISDAYELAEIYYIADQSQLSLQILLSYDLIKTSIRGRILAARCYISLNKLTKAAETIGEEYISPVSSVTEDYDEHSIRIKAIDSFLRGKIFFELGHVDFAKKCFFQALEVDVRCYEALHWLSVHNMLTSGDENIILQKPLISSNKPRKRAFDDKAGTLNFFVDSDERDYDSKTLNQDFICPGYKHKKLCNDVFGNFKKPSTFSQRNKSTSIETFCHQEKNPSLNLEGKKLQPLIYDDNCKSFEASGKTDKSISLNLDKASRFMISSNSYNFVNATYNFKISKEDILPSENILKKMFSITEHWDAIYWRAQNFYFLGHLNKSHDLLVELRKRDPTNLECISLLLTILCELKFNHQLVYLSQELKDKYGDHYVSLYASGLVHLLEGRREPARSQFLVCCEKYPHFIPSWIGYGHLSSDSSNIIKAYSTAARLHPDSFEPLLYLGRQYRVLGNYSLAETYLKRSLELSRYPNPHLVNELGLVKFATREYKAAQFHFHNGLAILQDHDSLENENILECLWTNLGHCYRKESELNSALLCFKNAYNLNPKSPITIAGLAMITDVLGQANEYVDFYYKAILCDPENHIIKSLLTRAIFENAEVLPKQVWSDLNHFKEHSLMLDRSDLLDSILPPPTFPIPSQRRKYPPMPDSATRALGLNTSEINPTYNILSFDEEILEKTIS